MSGPLSHVRVLDLSRIMAGPWCGQVLADLGADVIKVERLGAGDDTRRWGPPYLRDRDGTETGESGYFLSVNRGKRSIELDISTPEGQAVVRKLASTSDILLENFKVGGLVRYGLGPDDLRAVNPRLIYCSITGFGTTGPKASEVAYDFMIQAMGGLMSITGAPDGVPGGGPQKVGVPIIDIVTGMYAAVGVLAALARRSETGQGEFIDLAMLDVSAAMLANQAMSFLVSGTVPIRRGNKHPNIQPQDVFAVADGHIVVAVGNDDQFVRFARALDLPDLAGDERFRTNRARVENLGLLIPLIEERLLQRGVSEWLSLFNAAQVPCGPINTVDRVLEHEQINHRQMVRTVPHPLTDDLKQVVSPLRFAQAPLSYDRPPPLLGEHSDEILAELGLAGIEQDPSR